ncbi:hypothetical protein QNH23_17055 [Siminovitchia fortis]|uniref:Ribosomal protein L7/L12 C-terminal domain-containing protein n=1 Tax=Siminovitchia fortis TaxID=254758 RepID=A0A443IM53_9BACI|nr:hypothetical protein [Siminovitchia fortis]RWR06124.1 hypothetical protein D4N35_014655 [Siminovitchia fortis]WHY81557.1 hypothetical protein QNH23_17055 [Siminovitchia fortis]
MDSIAILLSLFFLAFMVFMTFLMVNVGSNGKRLIKLEKKLEAMQEVLNQAAEKWQLSGPPINDQLQKLLKEGKEVEAVRMAMKGLGLSLEEAKKYIDDFKK